LLKYSKMQKRFHINPATRQKGSCRAVKKCPFGEGHHFSQKTRAADALNSMNEAYSSYYQNKNAFVPISSKAFTKELHKQFPAKYHTLILADSFAYITKKKYYLKNGTIYVSGVDGISKRLIAMTPKSNGWIVVADYIAKRKELEVYFSPNDPQWAQALDPLSKIYLSLASEDKPIAWGELSEEQALAIAPLIAFPELQPESVSLSETPELTTLPQEFDPFTIRIDKLPFRS
jgi:hypothetical protein